MTSPPDHAIALPRIESNRIDSDIPIAVLTAGLLLFALAFFNEANFRTREPDNSSTDAQIVLKLGLCAICGTFGFVHLHRTGRLLLEFPGVLIILFGVWALFTAPMATDFTYTAGATASLWCILLFAPAALVILGKRRVLQILVAAELLFLVGCWLTYYLYPELGRDPFLDPDTGLDVVRLGGLQHPNATGRQAALTLALLLIAGYEKVLGWRTVLIAGGFAALTLLLAESRTAWLAAIAATGLAATWKMDRWWRTSLAASAMLMLVLWFFIGADFDRLFSSISRSGNAEEIYSLTGRTELWRFSIDQLKTAPLFGFGHGGARFVCEHNGWPTTHAHNTVLNVMLGTGLIGGLLVLGMFVAQGAAFLHRPKLFPDMMLVVVFVAGLADTVLFHAIPASFTTVWAISLFWRSADEYVDGDDDAPGDAVEDHPLERSRNV
jgi:exopolysaccharide production protein ExoQ